MKKWKLTFRNFRGLDRRTTQMGTSYSGKPTDIGFESMYWLIKEWVLHPLPWYTSLQNGTGRLFKVGTNMLFMHAAGVDIWNGTAFLPLITQTHDTTDMTLRDIKPFFETIATWGVSLTFSAMTDQSITVTNTMVINKYVNKHVTIWLSGQYQTLYITGNDAHNLYVDWLVNGDLAAAGCSITVFDHDAATIVYDGTNVRRYTVTGTVLWTASAISWWFIEVFSNRLFVMQGNTITFSTFNSSQFANTPFNFIPVEWTIVDEVIIGNVMVIFTTNGTYWLTGTGFTTMNFPKISEFAPSTRVYPKTQIDTTYLIRNGYIRVFDVSNGLQPIQYNYTIIPDTQGEIFTIERGIIFPLWHGTTKQWIITVEWAKTMLSSTTINITNFYDYPITDLLEFKWVIYLISQWVLYKQSGTVNPSFKLNTLRMATKTFWDTVDIAQWWNYPNSITATIDWSDITCNKNTGANQVTYWIRNMWYTISVSATTSDPISYFNIYYLY